MMATQSPETTVRPIAIVVPAGGGGTRLWPRSRKDRPKQFLDIVKPGLTMLQATVDRVSPALATSENVFVITNARHAQTVREQLHSVPPQNIVGEPVGRDSAPAIGIMAALIESRLGSDAIMAVFPSDHEILDVGGFLGALNSAIAAADQGYLVTLGIPPTSPDTGFGYIQRGDPITAGDFPTYQTLRFREKPNKETAEHYLASGEYFWNAGMFIATVGHFRSLYQQHLPDMEPLLDELIAVHGTPQQEVTFARIFPQLTKISFDLAIAEKADKVAVVPARIGWNDVGSWARLADVLEEKRDDNGNVAFGKHHALETSGSFIYAPHKFVATIGLDNVIIIDTPDALLIASKDKSEDVKRIVEMLDKEGRHDLL